MRLTHIKRHLQRFRFKYFEVATFKKKKHLKILQLKATVMWGQPTLVYTSTEKTILNLLN